MIYLLRALDLWWIVGKILVDSKAKVERSAFVHAFIGFDRECKVEDIVRIREFGLHGAAERELRKI